MVASAGPQCPVCHGPVWDERKSKYYKAGKSPLFKCQDKDCSGRLWEDASAAAAPASSPATNGQSAHSAPAGAPRAAVARALAPDAVAGYEGPAIEKAYLELYSRVATKVMKFHEGKPELPTPECGDLQAMTDAIWTSVQKAAGGC